MEKIRGEWKSGKWNGEKLVEVGGVWKGPTSLFAEVPRLTSASLRASLGVREGSTRASPCPSSGDVEPSALPSKSLSPGTDGCVREEAEVPPSLLLWLLRTGRPPPEAPGRPGPSGPSSFLQAGLLPSLNRSDFLTEGPSLQRAKTLLFIPKQTESIPTPLHPSSLRGLPT